MHETISVNQHNFFGKRVLLRTDYNVPCTPEGTIIDGTRIDRSLPTIKKILEDKGIVIILSHRGRPQGRQRLHMSLAPCAVYLSKLLKREVPLLKDCVGSLVQEQLNHLNKASICMLENVRFHQAEIDPEMDPAFAKNISQQGDCFVNEAFSVSHRKHSTITEVPKYFPKQSFSGILLEKEINMLNRIKTNPSMPFHVILGGNKLKTKLPFLEILAPKIDELFLTGGLAYPFLHLNGVPINSQLLTEESLTIARNFLGQCEKYSVRIHLPQDFILSSTEQQTSVFQLSSLQQGIPSQMHMVDTGPETIMAWEKHLLPAGTIFWNGPLGIYEHPPFDQATRALATYLGSKKGESTVIGGGDLSAALVKDNLLTFFPNVSTGGGATLAFFSQDILPGVAALTPPP